MKLILYTLVSVGIFLPALIKAQTGGINDLNFSAPRCFTDPTNYGDSLTGFDEQAAKAELLGNSITSFEYVSCMINRKRAFIRSTYYPVAPVVNSSSSSSPSGRQISGNNSTFYAPCVNEGFESTPVGNYAGPVNATAIQGWTISNYNGATGICPPANPAFMPGSPEIAIVNTPVLNIPALGTLGNSPLGGNNVVQLNDLGFSGLQTKISQTFPVTSSNTLYQFAFAGLWQDGQHACCAQPGFKINFFDCNGSALGCVGFTFTAAGVNCSSPGTSFSVSTVNGNIYNWSNWQVRQLDLTPWIGSCITVEVISFDCTAAGHIGMTYFDSQCGGVVTGQGLPSTGIPPNYNMSYCAGSNQAILQAPVGYQSHQWVSPTSGIIPASAGGTATTYTVANPVPNSVYTVNLVAYSGCHFTATYTIATTNVSITNVYTQPACSAGGSNGTATVVGSGSSTGYNYSWLNSSNAVVSTSAIANNLAPGNYTVTVSAIGNPGCGTYASLATVSIAPSPIINIVKPFCNNVAYVQSPLPGTNFRWYNGTASITAAQGGTAQSYTVVSPSAGDVYWLSYQSNLGCKDSVKFTLVSGAGQIGVSNNPSVCPGGTVAPVISITPASFYTPGNNSFSVVSTGTTAAFSASLNPTPALSYTPAGLVAGGTYSIMASDGSCDYATSFTVSLLVQPFTYSVTSSSPTLCAGQQGSLAVTISGSSYHYSWSPALFLNTTTAQQVIVSPLSGSGATTTLLYSVTVSPNVANCPQTQTIAIIYINPSTPVIQPIPALCRNEAQYTISVSPGGGTFLSSGMAQPINAITGVLTPSMAPLNGVNTFTYIVNAGGCSVFSAGSYSINAVPVITITGQSAACENAPVNWNISGADLYMFNPTTAAVGGFTAPATTTNYTITATSFSTSCSSETVKTLTVNPLPVISISGQNEACAGQSVTWTASGGNLYYWQPSALSTSIVTVLASTTVYTLTVTNTLTSCSATTTKMLSVDPCTGIENITKDNGIKVYPNPVINELIIEAQLPVHIILYSELSVMLLEKDLPSGRSVIDLGSYSSGMYLLKAQQQGRASLIKVLKVKN